MERRHTFRKHDRIYLRDEIRALFTSRDGLSAYPFRVICLLQPRKAGDAALKVLISVPKKRLKRAVDRNQVKRHFREAYRTLRHPLQEALEAGEDKTLLLGFIYLAEEVLSGTKIRKAVGKAITQLTQKFPEGYVTDEL